MDREETRGYQITKVNPAPTLANTINIIRERQFYSYTSISKKEDINSDKDLSDRIQI